MWGGSRLALCALLQTLINLFINLLVSETLC